MNDEEKIENLMQYNLMSIDTATAFVRAGGRCEYCGCDLLYDRLRYAVGEIDHLLPQARHHQLADCLDNMVYSCRLCNGLKRDFDPAEGSELTEDQLRNRRDEFVKSARKFIYGLRLEWDPSWLKVMKIMGSG